MLVRNIELFMEQSPSVGISNRDVVEGGLHRLEDGDQRELEATTPFVLQ